MKLAVPNNKNVTQANSSFQAAATDERISWMTFFQQTTWDRSCEMSFMHLLMVIRMLWNPNDSPQQTVVMKLYLQNCKPRHKNNNPKIISSIENNHKNGIISSKTVSWWAYTFPTGASSCWLLHHKPVHHHAVLPTCPALCLSCS